jgi:hypothetical protein
MILCSSDYYGSTTMVMNKPEMVIVRALCSPFIVRYCYKKVTANDIPPEIYRYRLRKVGGHLPMKINFDHKSR